MTGSRGCSWGRLAALCAGCVALLVPASAAATVSGSNGKIAYTGSTVSGSSEIFIANPDGSGATNLTNNPAQDLHPAWSPDGRLIAFTSVRAGGIQIFVMRADGTNVTQLTTGGGSEPAWSPDGTKIAFSSTRDDGQGDLHIMDADGGNVTNLTNAMGFDASAAWSPDGAQIAYARTPWDIWKIDADGTDATPLATDAGFDGYPSWSPDGSKITYSTDSSGSYRIYTMAANGSGQTPLTDPARQALDPAWSPNGARIIYQAQDGGGLHTIGSDGSNDTPLGLFGGGADWQPVQPADQPPQAAFSSSPSSSQTGQQVTFSSSTTGGSGMVSSLAWDLDNDGAFDDGTGPVVSWTFNSPGTHIVRLSATNSLGATDAIAHTVTVVDPPETVLQSGPSGTISSNTPSFTFSSPQAGAIFECRLDSGPFSPCSSPYVPAPLGEGQHMFEVRAKDGAGHTDPTPAQQSFVVDTAPQTQITSRPPASSASSSAKFSFTADQPATFECRHDGGPWAPCSSPWEYADLSNGSHSFEVRATDLNSNVDATPDVAFWTIKACAPPSLKGKSFSAAKRLIRKAGCRLGKVRKPAGVKPQQLVVVGQKVRDNRVDLRLRRKH